MKEIKGSIETTDLIVAAPPSRLASRKLWVTVVGGLLIYLNGFLPEGSRLPQELLMAIAGLAAVYILGEAAVDSARARRP